VVDCSVIVKWKIPTEDDAAAAEQLLLDWEHSAVEVCAPYLLQAEVMSAFLRAHRRERVSADEAREAIRDLLALPFVLFDVASVVERAFAIAQQYQQRAYDCLYVALAEREGVEELWTGDRRLYNALHIHHAFVRWIGDYQRKRPEEEADSAMPHEP
jgi:predicted nucleic acid-binding protein